MRHVVRNLASGQTHVVTLPDEPEALAPFTQFGKPYTGLAEDGVAACGVRLKFGAVVMQKGTKVRCRPCAHVTGVSEQEVDLYAKA